MPAGRPRTRTKEEKYIYDKQYIRSNIVTISLTFNKLKPEDMALLDWINSREESKVSYIKQLVRKDMRRKST